MNNNFIFILGSHKSGTSLLRSLLDNHHDIISIPIETHPFKHLGFPIDYSLRKNEPTILDTKKIYDNLCSWISLVNGQNDSNYGGTYGYKQFNVDIFRKRMKKIVNYKRTDFNGIIRIYFDSIIESLLLYNRGRKYIVEKSVENFEFAEILNTIFPKSKFIHIIRNPYSNLVSLRKYYLNIYKRYPYYGKIIDGINAAFYYLERNKRTLSNYYILKYEDLLLYPEKEMKKISEYLNITYSETLINPTILGEKWNGNSINNTNYNKISARNINKWKDDIFDIEIFLINKYLKKILVRYEYSSLSLKQKIKVILPLRNENLNIYMKNRMYLKA